MDPSLSHHTAVYLTMAAPMLERQWIQVIPLSNRLTLAVGALEQKSATDSRIFLALMFVFVFGAGNWLTGALGLAPNMAILVVSVCRANGLFFTRRYQDFGVNADVNLEFGNILEHGIKFSSVRGLAQEFFVQ